MSEIKSDHCFILCLCTTSVCFRLCLPVSEIKSDQCFILCLFTGRCYIRQVSDFACVCVCLRSNRITVSFCVFAQQVSVFVSVCLCPKSNQINVLYCVLTERCYIRQVYVFVCVCLCLKSNQINVLYFGFSQAGAILDKCLISSVSACV